MEPATFEYVKNEVFSILSRLTKVVNKFDTSTEDFAFVIDEDDMRSDLDTKVPTQQSVKAYVDNLSIDFTHTFLLMGT